MWSLPTSILPICGTISPRKLIAPTTAVEMLASITAITEIIIRVRFTFTPRLLAVLSSSASRLHLPINSTESTSPTTTYGNNVAASSHVFWVIFPSTIDATPVLSPPDMEFTTLDIPVKNASTATPVSIIRNGLKPPFHERA